MYHKFIFPILAMTFHASILFGQTVSTLVNDSVRQFESIHWHPDGRIYSVDYVNGSLYQIETNGNITDLVQGIPAMVGGGFDANDNFYFCSVASPGNVYRLNSDNSYTVVASGLNQPISVLSSASPDTIYVTEYGGNSIAKVSLSGGTVTPWVDGAALGLSGPDAIIYNHLNEIVVANFSNNKLFKVTPAGVLSLFSTLPSSGIMGYCTRVGTKLYVPSIAGKKVFVIDELGNATSIAGTGMTGSNDGNATAATFTFPNGICSNPAGDTLLVTDGQRIRVITDLDQTNTLEESSTTFDFTLHPNAVQNELNISIATPYSIPDTWIINDMSGKIILTDSIQSTQNTQDITLNVSDLMTGQYRLTLTKGGAVLGSKSFLKSDEL